MIVRESWRGRVSLSDGARSEISEHFAALGEPKSAATSHAAMRQIVSWRGWIIFVSLRGHNEGDERKGSKNGRDDGPPRESILGAPTRLTVLTTSLLPRLVLRLLRGSVRLRGLKAGRL